MTPSGSSDSRTPLKRTRISSALREQLRKAATDLVEWREIPPEQFPGHKGIACANLEGFLGRYTIAVLNALEATESELDRFRGPLMNEAYAEIARLNACDRAANRVYERLIRQLSTEYTGQVAELAKQAFQEAAQAETEAEKRESERSGVFG